MIKNKWTGKCLLCGTPTDRLYCCLKHGDEYRHLQRHGRTERIRARKKTKPGAWVNPFAGMTIDERIEAIARRAESRS